MSRLGDFSKAAQGKGGEDMQAAEVLLGLFEGSNTSEEEAKVSQCAYYSSS